MDGYNPFLPNEIKSYRDLMNSISADELFIGLVGHGLFPDKLPPIFTGLSFLKYISDKQGVLNRRESHDWVRFRMKRDIGSFRELGIPNPFAHARLAFHLQTHWEELRQYFTKHTANQSYRVSRTHIRKIPGTDELFHMNYGSPESSDLKLTLSIGMKYRVKCDISKCFPSIYTHAIDWALIGKSKAKNNRNGKICSWSHEIDTLAENTTNGETHGLIIGPHTSNLLSEIILCRVDESLINEGYTFVRFIDDYWCYANSLEEANSFPFALDKNLSLYGLSINQKKTEFSTLPETNQEEWVRALQDCQSEKEILSVPEVRKILDTAIHQTNTMNGKASCINYALKMIAKKPLKSSTKHYLARAGSHLLYLYPYLINLADDYIFHPANMTPGQISYISNLLFDKSMRERDFLSCCYALYFAIIYEFSIDNIAFSDIEKSSDCILMLLSWIYAKEKNMDDLESDLHETARNLYINNSFDTHWLFVYEVLERGDFNNNDSSWKALKKAKVSFVDANAFKRKRQPVRS